jgi:SulP family sulfate permease
VNWLTHTAEGARTAPGWLQETIAGCSGALATLPVVLTLGLLAFSSLGVLAPPVGLLAAFVTSCVGGGLHALFSRTSMPASGPSSPTALTLAALVAQLMADPHLPLTPTGVQAIVALCGLAVMLSGALQIGFSLIGLARLARLVPQPVLAGFMNSAALLIVLSQIPSLLDLPLGANLSMASVRDAQPIPIVLGLGTAGCIWLFARRWPRLPAALLGVLCGTAVHALCTTLAPAQPAGATVGHLPFAWPWPPAVLAMLRQTDAFGLLQAHAVSVVVTAFSLAAIGALESSLNVRALDQLLSTRHDPRHELTVLGCSNLACGLLGGLPLSVSRIRALATLQAGGHRKWAALIGALALGPLYLFGQSWLALLPLAVLAGVMLTVAVRLSDRWTARLLSRWWSGDHSRDLTLSLGVVALVIGAAAWKGMPAGIGLGVLLSLLAFALRMNRPLVYDRYLGSTRPSRRIYPVPVEVRLRSLREGIVVLELEGALFFGSGDQLLDEADTLATSCRCLVLDLRRVAAIDESGAVALQSAVARAGLRGIRVELAGLADGSPPALALSIFAASLPQWPDADRAIEAAEHHLLGDADVRAMAEVPLADASLLAGLDTTQVAVVLACLQHRRLETGELLFGENEPGDCLYVVSRGSVSVLSAPDRHGRTQRYLSVSPGMMFGETAMLDGRGRTAAAVADAPTDVHSLKLDALDALGRTHPGLAIRLHRNIALHLSQRLRSAADAWRAGTR